MSEKPSGGLKAEITLRLQDYPELVAQLRREMADVLMEAADDAEVEGRRTMAERLRQIAYNFDAGLRVDSGK